MQEPFKVKIELTPSDSTVESACSCGVPFPQSSVLNPCLLNVLDSQKKEVTHQWRTVQRWPDGSIKWALLDFVPPPPETVLEIQLSGDRDSSQTQSVASTNHSKVNAFENSTSFPLEFAKHQVDLQVEVESAGELKTIIQESRVTDDGPVRCSHWLEGDLVDESGAIKLQWTAHVHAYSNSSLQRWALTIRNPQAANHPGGIWELGDPNTVNMRSVNLELGQPSVTSLEQVQFKLGPKEAWQTNKRLSLRQFGSGGENFQSPIHRNSANVVHSPMKGFEAHADSHSQTGDRATPAVCLQFGDDLAIGVYASHFWQNFPKSLSTEDDKIQLGLFPGEFGVAHELQPGEQKTHEFWVATGSAEEVKHSLDAARNTRTARVDPNWVCKANVIPWLTSLDREQNEAYLGLVNQAIEGDDTFIDKRERIDEYGWRNFGDLYGDHEAIYSEPENPYVSHYNNQYDMVLGMGLNFLRGGSNTWLDQMRELARHTIDIDFYHTNNDKSCYNHGMFWHTVHYVDAGLATHRTYPRGTCGGGPSSGHAYARGLLLHYCLTGDETARQAVVKMGEWMIHSEDGSATKYKWLARGETGLTTASGTEEYHGPGRGPGNAVEVLVTAFELTHERRFLDQAEKIIRRVVHPKQDITRLDLLDAENKWFYTLFLQALGRYLEVKISMNEIDHMYAYGQRTLLNYADWMAAHEYPYLDKPELLEYPNETWAAQEMRKVEVFQWAARHAIGEQQERFLERASFFFDTGCEQLNKFATKSLCRPIALLLTNGYSRNWFQETELKEIPAAPRGSLDELQVHAPFISQKTRAIRRAKLAVAASAIGIATVIAFAAFFLTCGN